MDRKQTEAAKRAAAASAAFSDSDDSGDDFSDEGFDDEGKAQLPDLAETLSLPLRFVTEPAKSFETRACWSTGRGQRFY